MHKANSTSNVPAPLRRVCLAVLWLALAAAYLIASATGMRVVATAVVALMVGVLLSASGRIVTGVLVGAALAVLCVYFSASMQFIVFAPPLAAFAFMAFFFYRTLRPGAEPLITQVARMEHADLPADMARYTRTLTAAWSGCFMLLFIVALLLVPLLPLDSWSRVVHGLGYFLPGTLFFGEYAYRHHRFRERRHGSLMVLIPNIVAASKLAALSPDQRDGQSHQ